ISILDSSFNPPHNAHLALASEPFPPRSVSEDLPSAYTHRLLVFSTTNVDKKPASGDPTLEQRVEMIKMLASNVGGPESKSPAAVGLINEPTFVGKSRIIHSYLLTRGFKERPHLTFIVGTDTLTRFFDPRYYGAVPGGMNQALDRFFVEEGSSLVCGRRKGEEEVEAALLKREEIRQRVDNGQVRFFADGSEDWAGVSSTDVRKAVQRGDWDGVDRLVTPEIAAYIKDQRLY
ncbi:hypothetical protein BD324DRAFT_563689, partial [Kockovaella imperatae]